MLLLVGVVGSVGPRYKGGITLGNDSKNKIVEKIAPLISLGTILTSEPFPTWTKY